MNDSSKCPRVRCMLFQIVSGNIVSEGIKFARSVTSKDPRQVCLRYREVKIDGDLDKISEGG